MDIALNQSGQLIHLPEEVGAWTARFTSEMMDAGELTYLAGVLAAYPWGGRDIVVEIGAYRGSTSVFMARVLQRLGHRIPVLSIDSFERVVPAESDASHETSAVARGLRRLSHWVASQLREPPAPDPTNPKGVLGAYLEMIHDHQLEDVCLPLVAFSKDAARVVPDTVGVLVVDGGHQYPIVSQDLELYVPKVQPGGFIFIDDYVAAYPGVQRAVDEYFASTCLFTIVHKSYFVVAQRD